MGEGTWCQWDTVTGGDRLTLHRIKLLYKKECIDIYSIITFLYLCMLFIHFPLFSLSPLVGALPPPSFFTLQFPITPDLQETIQSWHCCHSYIFSPPSVCCLPHLSLFAVAVHSESESAADEHSFFSTLLTTWCSVFGLGFSIIIVKTTAKTTYWLYIL